MSRNGLFTGFIPALVERSTEDLFGAAAATVAVAATRTSSCSISGTASSTASGRSRARDLSHWSAGTASRREARARLGRGVAERLASGSPESLFAPEVVAAVGEADLCILNLECCSSERGAKAGCQGRERVKRAGGRVERPRKAERRFRNAPVPRCWSAPAGLVSVS